MFKIIGHVLYLTVIVAFVIIIGATFSTVNIGIEATDSEIMGNMGESFGPWLIPVGFFLYLFLAIKGWLPFVSKK